VLLDPSVVGRGGSREGILIPPRPLARSADDRLSRAAVAFLGLRLIAAKLRHARQRAPGPPRQLPVTELFVNPDRESQVPVGFVKTPELALGDSPRRPGVGELPSGAELGADRHGLVEPGAGRLT